MIKKDKNYKYEFKKIYLLIILIIIAFLIYFIFIILFKDNNVNNIVIQKTSVNNSELEVDNGEKENDKKENKNEINNLKTEDDYVISYYKGLPVIAKLEIPKINLNTDVLRDYSEANLKLSVTKFYKGLPNEIGNFCIAGHNYVVENMFHNLKKLEIGDTIFLTDKFNGIMEYCIYNKEIVNPKDVNCLSQETDGKIELTLITCTSDSQKRIIIKARAK